MESRIRETLTTFCHRLYNCGHVVARDGNFSARTGNGFLISPTGICKKDVRPEDFVKMTLEGKVISSGQPSSEEALHRLLYQRYPEIGAVCHAHPFYTVLTTLHGGTLKPELLTEARMHLTAIAYVPDLSPGSEALATAVQGVLEDGLQAFILRRHGSFTWGADIETAYYQTESLERLARTSFYESFYPYYSRPGDH